MKNKFCKISIGFLSICMMFLICLHFDGLKNSSNLKADVNDATNDSLLPDLNLYKCVVDSYNLYFDTTYDYTHDFTESELSQIEQLSCDGHSSSSTLDKKIKNTTGIEKMTGLTSLDLENNNFKTIDLSKNVNLKEIILASNGITSLDLSKNTELENLIINMNNLTSLDLSKNIKLKTLAVTKNALNKLDLSKNNLLEELYFFESFSTNITIDSLSYELLTLPSGFDFEYGITSYNNSSTK